ncbi:hypothetical protein IWQ60_004968 [Tieghemiomyces parasiticus]|uniref:Uncharacterized protein n=1 Tax=Tieghemiomyces parasiticus TaxID=78921 RepID=A0A9W8AAG3_9FUNG|nr:hypothetical protein IWQ60_004968 [Tieghemiomyces parasiticus]
MQPALLHPYLLPPRGKAPACRGSSTCTETFYRAQATEQLQQERADEDEKRRMMEILKRLSEFDGEIWDAVDADADEPMSELSKRLEDLDLGNVPDLVSSGQYVPIALRNTLGRLWTKDFYRRYLDPQHADPNSIGELLWEPWWKCAVPLVVEKDVAEDSAVSTLQRPPQPLADIPPFKSLLPRAPHPSTLFRLASTVFTYTYVKRHFNGDWTPDEDGVVRLFWRIEPTLSKNTVDPAGSCEEALLLNLEQIRQYESRDLPVDLYVFLLQDTIDILSTPHHLLAALSDLHRLFQRRYARLAGEGKPKPAHRCFVSAKKVLFLLSFTQMLLDHDPACAMARRTSMSAERPSNDSSERGSSLLTEATATEDGLLAELLTVFRTPSADPVRETDAEGSQRCGILDQLTGQLRWILRRTRAEHEENARLCVEIDRRRREGQTLSGTPIINVLPVPSEEASSVVRTESD